MKHIDVSMKDLQESINLCPKTDRELRKKLLFRKLTLLVGEDLKQYQQAKQLIDSMIRSEFNELNEMENEFLNRMEKLIQQKMDQNHRNTLNIESKEDLMKKSLRALRTPFMMKKSAELFEKWSTIDGPSALYDSLGFDSISKKLIAKNPIEKDCIVSLENPMVFITKDPLGSFCQNCLVGLDAIDTIFPCSYRCQSIYCSEQCRSDCWSRSHRIECLSDYSIDYLKPSIRLLLRLCTNLDNDSLVRFTSGSEEIHSFKQFFSQIISFAIEKIDASIELDRQSLCSISLQTIILAKFLKTEPFDRLQLFRFVLLFEYVIMEHLIDSIETETFRVDENLNFYLDLDYDEILQNDLLNETNNLNRYDNQIRSSMKIPTSQTIAFALYPFCLHLDRCDQSSSVANIESSFYRLCRILRSKTRLIPNTKLILDYEERISMFPLQNARKKSFRSEQTNKKLDMDQLKSIEKLYQNLNENQSQFECLRLSLANFLANFYSNHLKNFRIAFQFNKDCIVCIEKLKQQSVSKIDWNLLERLSIGICLRYNQIVTELFIEEKVDDEDNRLIQLAKDGLVNCSELLRSLNRLMVPLGLIRIRSKMEKIESQKHSLNDSSIDLERFFREEYLLPIVLDLEERMINYDLFISFHS